MRFGFIRTHQEGEGGIENSTLRITVWHHEACRVMTNCDRDGLIFLSQPHSNNRYFSCSSFNTTHLYPRYEVYRGYIVFAFSVPMFVCLSVCLSVCKLFSVKDFSAST